MEQTKRLYRSRDNRILAGVAGGLGEYFGIDPVIVRIVFAVLILANGIGAPLYILLWVIIPEEPLLTDKAKAEADKKADSETVFEERVEKVASEVRQKIDEFEKQHPSDGRSTGGVLLVLIGLFLLLGNIFSFDFMSRLWPILLVVLGVVLLTRKPSKEKE